MTAGLIVFPFWPSLIWGLRTTVCPDETKKSRSRKNEIRARSIPASVCVFSSLVPGTISTNWGHRPGNFPFLGHLQIRLLSAASSCRAAAEFSQRAGHCAPCFTHVTHSGPPSPAMLLLLSSPSHAGRGSGDLGISPEVRRVRIQAQL